MPNGEESLSSLRYQITCTQQEGKKLLNCTIQENNHIKFLQRKTHITFPQRQDDRQCGCKRWSKPQVSPSREASNNFIWHFYCNRKRNSCKSGSNLVKKLCYLIERLYGVQISTPLKTSGTGIFHSNMQDKREFSHCFFTSLQTGRTTISWDEHSGSLGKLKHQSNINRRQLCKHQTKISPLLPQHATTEICKMCNKSKTSLFSWGWAVRTRSNGIPPL